MKHFAVHATRSGRWWSITIDQDPRAQTQARRLDQVEDVARSVLIDTEMLTSNEPVAFTVVTQADNLDDLRRRAVAAKQAAADASEEASKQHESSLATPLIKDSLSETSAQCSGSHTKERNNYSPRPNKRGAHGPQRPPLNCEA